MGLNIKNNDVHAAVRELAMRLQVTQTSAVEIAVRAKLAELPPEDRAAIAAYLKAIPPHPNGYPPRKPQG